MWLELPSWEERRNSNNQWIKNNFSHGNGNAKIYDAQETINVADLANGLYIVRIYGSEGNIYTGKLVIR